MCEWNVPTTRLPSRTAARSIAFQSAGWIQKLRGRVLTEAIVNGKTIKPGAGVSRSAPAAGGLMTVLQYQDAGGVRYFDVAGFPGRTLGLDR